MAISCPHKKLKSYLDLKAVVGKNLATALWVHYDGVVPESFYVQKATAEPLYSVDKNAKIKLKHFTDYVGLNKKTLSPQQKINVALS